MDVSDMNNTLSPLVKSLREASLRFEYDPTTTTTTRTTNSVDDNCRRSKSTTKATRNKKTTTTKQQRQLHTQQPPPQPQQQQQQQQKSPKRRKPKKVKQPQQQQQSQIQEQQQEQLIHQSLQQIQDVTVPCSSQLCLQLRAYPGLEEVLEIPDEDDISALFSSSRKVGRTVLPVRRVQDELMIENEFQQLQQRQRNSCGVGDIPGMTVSSSLHQIVVDSSIVPSVPLEETEDNHLLLSRMAVADQQQREFDQLQFLAEQRRLEVQYEEEAALRSRRRLSSSGCSAFIPVRKPSEKDLFAANNEQQQTQQQRTTVEQEEANAAAAPGFFTDHRYKRLIPTTLHPRVEAVSYNNCKDNNKKNHELKATVNAAFDSIIKSSSNNNNNGTTTTHSVSQQQQQLGDAIEIAPGLFRQLRSTQETMDALRHPNRDGLLVKVTCPCCALTMMCVNTAEYVLCPECRVVTPLLLLLNVQVQPSDVPPVLSSPPVSPRRRVTNTHDRATSVQLQQERHQYQQQQQQQPAIIRQEEFGDGGVCLSPSRRIRGGASEISSPRYHSPRRESHGEENRLHHEQSSPIKKQDTRHPVGGGGVGLGVDERFILTFARDDDDDNSEGSGTCNEEDILIENQVCGVSELTCDFDFDYCYDEEIEVQQEEIITCEEDIQRHSISHSSSVEMVQQQATGTTTEQGLLCHSQEYIDEDYDAAVFAAYVDDRRHVSAPLLREPQPVAVEDHNRFVSPSSSCRSSHRHSYHQQQQQQVQELYPCGGGVGIDNGDVMRVVSDHQEQCETVDDYYGQQLNHHHHSLHGSSGGYYDDTVLLCHPHHPTTVYDHHHHHYYPENARGALLTTQEETYEYHHHHHHPPAVVGRRRCQSQDDGRGGGALSSSYYYQGFQF